jgi:hypothetical protein
VFQAEIWRGSQADATLGTTSLLLVLTLNAPEAEGLGFGSWLEFLGMTIATARPLAATRSRSADADVNWKPRAANPNKFLVV